MKKDRMLSAQYAFIAGPIIAGGTGAIQYAESYHADGIWDESFYFAQEALVYATEAERMYKKSIQACPCNAEGNEHEFELAQLAEAKRMIKRARVIMAEAERNGKLKES